MYRWSFYQQTGSHEYSSSSSTESQSRLVRHHMDPLREGEVEAQWSGHRCSISPRSTGSRKFIKLYENGATTRTDAQTQENLDAHILGDERRH